MPVPLIGTNATWLPSSLKGEGVEPFAQFFKEQVAPHSFLGILSEPWSKAVSPQLLEAGSVAPHVVSLMEKAASAARDTKLDPVPLCFFFVFDEV